MGRTFSCREVSKGQEQKDGQGKEEQTWPGKSKGRKPNPFLGSSLGAEHQKGTGENTGGKMDFSIFPEPQKAEIANAFFFFKSLPIIGFEAFEENLSLVTRH